jgi:hypothetical protein
MSGKPVDITQETSEQQEQSTQDTNTENFEVTHGHSITTIQQTLPTINKNCPFGDILQHKDKNTI